MSRVRLDGMQRLAVAQALVNSCKAMVDSKGGPHGAPNLRTDADDELRSLYEKCGVDRMRISINGDEVATIAARFTKPVDGAQPEICDDARFVEWLRTSDGGLDAIRRLVSGYRTRNVMLDAATRDGELPDGCRMVKRSEPKQWAGTTLRVDAEKVAEALSSELPEAVAGLIGGAR